MLNDYLKSNRHLEANCHLERSERSNAKTLSLLFGLFLILNFCLPVFAVTYNELRNFMLQGDVESVITRVELKKDLPLKLNDDEAELYIQSLLVMGELEAADSKLDHYIDKYPKNQSLKALKKNYLFSQGRFTDAEVYKLDDYEKTQFKLMKELDEYLVDLRLYKIKNPKLINQVFITNEDLDSSLRSKRKKIIKYANKLEENRPYFRPKLEYLLELKDPELNKSIEQEALSLIKSKRTELFPKTMDFYELALAYKALAILSIQANDNKSATGFIKLGQQNIYKMRSIWLIEDIIVEKKIMKTTEHISKFGYLIPQWIVALRDEFDSYLN